MNDNHRGEKMANSTVEVYEELKSKIGDRGAKILIEYLDSKIEKTAVTKLDLTNVENSLRTEIKEIDYKMKLYFLGIAVLIIITNPKIIDIAARVFGLIK